MRFLSKLPDVGTTIFTVMSRRALEEGALNIGQGFPDYPIDPRLAASLVDVIGEGRNQYAPMEGVVDLREQISAKLQTSYGRRFDPHAEITVTCGGTEALYDAIQAVVGSGDEAIIFDPAYDSYEPAVRLAGGRCVRIALSPPTFRFEWDQVRRALSDRTRLIIINSPQNPSCTVADRDDLDALAALIRDRPITLLADEVYEHVLYDGPGASGIAGAQLCGIFIREDAACDRMASRVLRGAAAVDPRTSQGAPVQYFQHRLAVAIRHCALSRGIPRCLGWVVGVFSSQAGSARGTPARLGIRTHPGCRHLFSTSRL